MVRYKLSFRTPSEAEGAQQFILSQGLTVVRNQSIGPGDNLIVYEGPDNLDQQTFERSVRGYARDYSNAPAGARPEAPGTPEGYFLKTKSTSRGELSASYESSAKYPVASTPGGPATYDPRTGKVTSPFMVPASFSKVTGDIQPQPPTAREQAQAMIAKATPGEKLGLAIGTTFSAQGYDIFSRAVTGGDSKLAVEDYLTKQIEARQQAQAEGVQFGLSPTMRQAAGRSLEVFTSPPLIIPVGLATGEVLGLGLGKAGAVAQKLPVVGKAATGLSEFITTTTAAHPFATAAVGAGIGGGFIGYEAGKVKAAGGQNYEVVSKGLETAGFVLPSIALAGPAVAGLQSSKQAAKAAMKAGEIELGASEARIAVAQAKAAQPVKARTIGLGTITEDELGLIPGRPQKIDVVTRTQAGETTIGARTTGVVTEGESPLTPGGKGKPSKGIFESQPYEIYKGEQIPLPFQKIFVGGKGVEVGAKLGLVKGNAIAIRPAVPELPVIGTMHVPAETDVKLINELRQPFDPSLSLKKTEAANLAGLGTEKAVVKANKKLLTSFGQGRTSIETGFDFAVIRGGGANTPLKSQNFEFPGPEDINTESVIFLQRKGVRPKPSEDLGGLGTNIPKPDLGKVVKPRETGVEAGLTTKAVKSIEKIAIERETARKASAFSDILGTENAKQAATKAATTARVSFEGMRQGALLTDIQTGVGKTATRATFGSLKFDMRGGAYEDIQVESVGQAVNGKVGILGTKGRGGILRGGLGGGGEKGNLAPSLTFPIGGLNYGRAVPEFKLGSKSRAISLTIPRTAQKGSLGLGQLPQSEQEQRIGQIEQPRLDVKQIVENVPRTRQKITPGGGGGGIDITIPQPTGGKTPFPPFGGGAGLPGGFSLGRLRIPGFGGRKTRYTPTVEAVAFNIKAPKKFKKRKLFSGFELRGL